MLLYYYNFATYVMQIDMKCSWLFCIDAVSSVQWYVMKWLDKWIL